MSKAKRKQIALSVIYLILIAGFIMGGLFFRAHPLTFGNDNSKGEESMPQSTYIPYAPSYSSILSDNYSEAEPLAASEIKTETLQRFYTTKRASVFTFSGIGNEKELQGVLNALKQNNSRATFFVSAEEAEQYPEQLEQIRLAIKENLPIDKYISINMRGDAIKEIRLGLEAGVDVGRYANEAYGWKQMYEMRTGLEHQIDIQPYCKPLYRADQMREIRLGIEEGLDVAMFSSMMYTAKDMRRIRQRLLSGEIQMAVHSMKDMPSGVTEGLVFSKAWKREDPRDVLVLKGAVSLKELKQGANIATGSKRRSYQLLKLRPDLNICPIRGNIDTRLRRLQEGLPDGTQLDGIVIAAAGLKRLGLTDRISEYLSPDDMIPAPAQGTLAIELAAKNAELLEMVNSLSDKETDEAVCLERSFLKEIGGDCHLPVGAYADRSDEGWSLYALFGNEDGSRLARTVVRAKEASSELVESAVKEIKALLNN